MNGIIALLSEALRAAKALANVAGEAEKRVFNAVDEIFNRISLALWLLLTLMILAFSVAFIWHPAAAWCIPILTLAFVVIVLYALASKRSLEIIAAVRVTEGLLEEHVKIVKDIHDGVDKAIREAISLLGIGFIAAIFLTVVPLSNDRWLALVFGLFVGAILCMKHSPVRNDLAIAGGVIFCAFFFIGGLAGFDEVSNRLFGLSVFDYGSQSDPLVTGYDSARLCTQENQPVDFSESRASHTVHYRPVVGCSSVVKLSADVIYHLQTVSREDAKKDWVAISCPDGRTLVPPRQPSRIRFEDLHPNCGSNDGKRTFLVQGNAPLTFIPQ